jgi:hypothetical protein
MVPGLLSSWMAASNVVIVNEQVAVFPVVSVAVQVTVVTPSGKQVPDGGLHATVTPGQLSDAGGVAYVTTVQLGLRQAFWSVNAVMFAGQGPTVGGCASLTVTVNMQLGPAAVVEHVTVVVPLGKNEPDIGEQATTPQVPLVTCNAERLVWPPTAEIIWR